MAGYVIHIAVGLEYLRKHHENRNQEEFIEGIIAPDRIKDKSQTHFGPKSSEPDLSLFLQEHPIYTDYDYGYFLHLVTDYLFYNHYIDTFSKAIYHDYDLLNARLIEKYHVILPESIQNQVFYDHQGDTVILNYELVCQLIDEISDYDLDRIINEINHHTGKWNSIRPLKRIS